MRPCGLHFHETELKAESSCRCVTAIRRDAPTGDMEGQVLEAPSGLNDAAHLLAAWFHQRIRFGKRHGVIGEIERATISDLTRGPRKCSESRASEC